MREALAWVCVPGRVPSGWRAQGAAPEFLWLQGPEGKGRDLRGKEG